MSRQGSKGMNKLFAYQIKTPLCGAVTVTGDSREAFT